MKSLIIFAFLAALAFATPEEDQIFEDYLQNFHLRIGRSSIEKAKENVIKKHRDIEKHNEKFRKGEELFEAGLNEFSWKSDEQFAKENLGSLDEPGNNTLAEKLPELRAGRALPDFFNWADKGVVRPVQNQGNCGSCYAFASVAAIESVACIWKKQCAKLSEQEAMECTSGCNGGSYGSVYPYTCKANGATSSSYSYTPYTRSTCSTSSRSRVSNSKACTWTTLNGKGAETIRQFLYNQGPMYAAFIVYNNFYSYSSGIYSSVGGSQLGGHAVLLVGWGTENGIPYWILKNSWGTGWGEKGYFRMRRGIDLAYIESRSVAVPSIS